MKILTKNIIEEFAGDVDETSFYNSYNIINDVITKALENIKQRNPYINKYQITIANEIFDKTEFCASTLDLFVVFDALQIELNSNKKKKNAFLKNLKLFFKEFKNNFSLFNSKKKKQKKNIKEIEKKSLVLNEYDVKMLYQDLMVQMSTFLNEKTNLHLKNNKITISNEDDIGIEINVYCVFKISDTSCKLYNIQNNSSIIIDYRYRFENFSIKNSQTNYMFEKQVKIFNNLYWNTIKQKPNQIFIESLLYNCPNDLFNNDNFDTTINLVNYLKNSTMQNLFSICDENLSLFKEYLNTVSFDMAYKFLNMLNEN